MFITKWNKCSRALGGIVIVGLVISMMTPLWNVIGAYIATGSELQPADAIVVLAAGLMEDGSLGDESMRRELMGLSLFKRGWAPKIVLSGPPTDNGVVEAAVRAKLAIEMGIPADDILQVTMVNTTRDEAQQVSELLGPAGLMKIVLVTESLHMRRARLVFERAGFQVFAAPSSNYQAGALQPEARLVLMRRVLREMGALIYYRLAGYI